MIEKSNRVEILHRLRVKEEFYEFLKKMNSPEGVIARVAHEVIQLRIESGEYEKVEDANKDLEKMLKTGENKEK